MTGKKSDSNNTDNFHVDWESFPTNEESKRVRGVNRIIIFITSLNCEALQYENLQIVMT